MAGKDVVMQRNNFMGGLVGRSKVSAIAVAAVAILSAMIGPNQGLAASNVPAKASVKEGLTRYLCTQAKRRDGFDWTYEDIGPAKLGGKYYGIGDPKIIPPPPGASVRQVVKILQPQLPRDRIWQDAANRRILHLAVKRLLAWKGYPMGRKVTAVGTMSIRQLMSRVVSKVAPHISLYSGVAIAMGTIPPTNPPLKVLEFPLKIDQKNVSIRHLLTDGWPYAGHGNGHGHGEIWFAEAFEVGHYGRFKRLVQISVDVAPLAWRKRHKNLFTN